MKLATVLHYLGISLLVCVVFGAGFYFGYKNSESKSIIVASVNTDRGKIVEPLKAREVDGVFWIQPGKEPACPENAPIKGKFGTDGLNQYYLPENKNYNKIKTSICFATEEFARDKAGFIKKF